jgi:sulfur carrier protein
MKGYTTTGVVHHVAFFVHRNGERWIMVYVNGNKISITDNLSLYDYLVREGYKNSFVAVECNGFIVPKTQYKEKILIDGDVIEVVSFVGGG